jgi:RNA polymerase sigma factor (sigma-70 family)
VSDADLVARARRGDAAAFGELVDRHKTAVYRAALAALGSPADAEDAAQDAFISAYQRLASFRGDASFKTWLLSIAWNQALNRRRSRTRWWRRQAGLEGQEPPEGRREDLSASLRQAQARPEQGRGTRVYARARGLRASWGWWPGRSTARGRESTLEAEVSRARRGWGSTERSEDVGRDWTDALEANEPSPEQAAADRELRDAIVGEIRALPAKMKDALLLAQSGEYTYDEIGAMLGTPVGTIKWRVSEARKAIKIGLRKRGFTDVG